MDLPSIIKTVSNFQFSTENIIDDILNDKDIYFSDDYVSIEEKVTKIPSTDLILFSVVYCKFL